MNIFLLAYALTLINGFFCKCIKQGRKLFCITSGFVYFLIAALRSWYVGGDSFNYKYMFEAIGILDLNQVLQFSEQDPFFAIFLKIINSISGEYTFLFAIVAAFFVITVWSCIYRYSDDPVMSIIILLAFSLYQFSMTGMRQTIAIGFIVLAFMAVKEKKRFLPYVYILMGSLFHISSLIYIVIPLVRRTPITVLTLRLATAILVVTFVLRRSIAGFLVFFLEGRGYGLSLSDSGLTMMLVVAALYVMAVVFMKEYSRTDKDYCILYYTGWLAVFFEILVTSQNIFFRIAFYFLIFYIILIPNVVSKVENRNTRIILKTSIYLLLSIQYIFYTIGSCYILPYTAFWQV